MCLILTCCSSQETSPAALHTSHKAIQNVATKCTIVHIQQGVRSCIKLVLQAAQTECAEVTRDDINNALRSFKNAGTVELLSQYARTSPHIPKSSTVQPTSPTIMRLSVEAAVKAVEAQQVTHKAAAAACGVSPGTIFNRRKCLHIGPHGPPNKIGSKLVQHLAEYVDTLQTTFKMHVFTFQVHEYAQYMIEGDVTHDKCCSHCSMFCKDTNTGKV